MFLAVFLSLCLPGQAVYARRCHDVGRSGWTLKPFATFERGDPWPNRYGPPPGKEEAGRPPPAWPTPIAQRGVAPAPGAPAAPAVFVVCSGCGRPINREVSRCPYCRSDIAATEDQRAEGSER
jgi:hypothetical protein